MYRGSVRIVFLLASLNDIDIFTCDIVDAYLNAKCREKFWTEAGTYFGTEKGMVMIIAIALYGLKSSGAAWRGKLAENLMLVGYKSSEADSYVWMKQDFKTNGYPYYKYMLHYVDDLLYIFFKPKEDMDALNTIYRLKKGFGPPYRYLGVNVEKV